MPIGALIGAGASLLGGFLNRKSAEKQQDKALAANARRIRTTVADAKAAGIHPLAALGSSAPTYSINAVPGMGDAVASAGQQLGDGIDRMNSRKMRQQQMTTATRVADSEISLNEAQARLAEARAITELANVEKRLQYQAGTTNALPSPAALISPDKNPDGSAREVQIEPHRNLPSRHTVTFGDRTVAGPNPEAFELGLGEIAAAFAIYGPQLAYQMLTEHARENQLVTKLKKKYKQKGHDHRMKQLKRRFN